MFTLSFQVCGTAPCGYGKRVSRQGEERRLVSMVGHAAPKVHA